MSPKENSSQWSHLRDMSLKKSRERPNWKSFKLETLGIEHYPRGIDQKSKETPKRKKPESQESRTPLPRQIKLPPHPGQSTIVLHRQWNSPAYFVKNTNLKYCGFYRIGPALIKWSWSVHSPRVIGYLSAHVHRDSESCLLYTTGDRLNQLPFIPKQLLSLLLNFLLLRFPSQVKRGYQEADAKHTPENHFWIIFHWPASMSFHFSR